MKSLSTPQIFFYSSLSFTVAILLSYTVGYFFPFDGTLPSSDLPYILDMVSWGLSMLGILLFIVGLVQKRG